MPSDTLRPTRNNATIRFSDAAASPGKGFSRMSDNSTVDIFDLFNTLYRIFHIQHALRPMSRRGPHKRVCGMRGRGEAPFPSNEMPLLKKRIQHDQVHADVRRNAYGVPHQHDDIRRGEPRHAGTESCLHARRFPLCSAYIPDPAGVEACLKLRKSDLSEACKAVFEQATSGSSRSR
jgi:hypothetical protein